MEGLGERLLVDSESETTSARSLKLQSRLRLLTHLLVLAATLLVAGIVLDRHVQWVSTAAHLVPLASMGIMCRPDLSPSQYCPDGKPCPASGSCPSEPSLPSWTMQPPPIGSPARIWSSDAQERAQAGCGMIQEIAMKGVIDQFMLLQPGTREILWNRSLDHEGTIERMEFMGLTMKARSRHDQEAPLEERHADAELEDHSRLHRTARAEQRLHAGVLP
jgi:hypothetical protein